MADTDATAAPPEGALCALPGCNFPAIRWVRWDGRPYPVCGSVPDVTGPTGSGAEGPA